MVSKSLVSIVISVAWAIASVVAMTYGTLLNWPDNVHTDYGFPLTFATHTTSTFVGAVDNWSLDLGALSADLSFWFLGMIVIVIASAYFQSRTKNS